VTDAWRAVDHLVLAVPDLEAGIAHCESVLGVRASAGGRHPRWGTHNAILGLGPHVYLEIIAADPERERPESVTVFGLDRVTAPRLAAWAAGDRALEKTRATAMARGIRPGAILDGMRQRPDGTRLSWLLTDPATVLADGLGPFFIDWQGGSHPAEGAPAAGRLQGLRAAHPDPESAGRTLAALGFEMPIDRAEEVRLIATIRTNSRSIVHL
jgi:hypothetical protein